MLVSFVFWTNPILEWKPQGDVKLHSIDYVEGSHKERIEVGFILTTVFPLLYCLQSTLVSYLLEKSRVVFQMTGERNYHIFYQLVAGAEENPSLRDRLMLDGCEAFSYLNQSGVTRIDGVVEEVGCLLDGECTWRG